MLTPEERAHLEALLLSESSRQMRESILAPLFDRQRDFIASTARRKALFCSRRAGKTTLTPRRLVLSALEHPGTLQRFWAITRLRSKELIWEELRKVNAEMNADMRFNETELSVRLGNDSWIRLSGADKLKEVRKKLGDKLMLAQADEAQLYPDDAIKQLVEDVAGPALEDLRGTFELFGTPGPVCAGYWWDITRDDGVAGLPGWEVHRWTVLDNPAYPRWAGRADWRLLAVEWLRELKAQRQWADDHPTYLREYCGRWVNDVGALVYRYDDARNGFDGTLPDIGEDRWVYTAGSDLGTRDAFAIVVWAFSRARREAYEAFSFAESGLNPNDWEQHWERIVRAYRPLKIRVDTGGLGGAIVDGILSRRRGQVGAITLPLEPAQKTEKRAHQELLNARLLSSELMVNRRGVLAQEMRKLPKDSEDETKEDERFPNHACDAGLYGFRDLLDMHYLVAPAEQEPPRGTTDDYKRRLEQRLASQKTKPWWMKR